MLGLALRTLALLVGCIVLIGIWRAIPLQRLRALTALGLGLRSSAAAAVFLISFLDLPILESLHFGNGFWFYALDGMTYYDLASDAAGGGLDDIWFLDRTGPSVTYTQAFALCVFLFGSTPAAGIFLNLAAYLGSAYVIARWGSEEGNERGALLTLLAVTFAPMWIVWTTQPLKDTFFIFLTALYFYALALWRRYWIGKAEGERTLLMSLLLMVVAIHGLAGIRGYFAFIVWGGSALFFAHTALVSARRRSVAALVGFVSFVLCANVIVWSAEAHLSATSRQFIAPFVPTMRAPQAVPGFINEAMRRRHGFEGALGATQFDPGSRLAGVPGGKLIAGIVATLLPRDVANSTLLVSIKGERGLLSLAGDIDTLFFDAVLIIAAFLLVRNWKRLADPIAVQLVILAAAVGLPLVYVVNNFGTLMRLREMILICIALIPTAVAGWRIHAPDDISP